MSAPGARAVLRPTSPRPREEQLALEQRFFKSLRLPNGTYKTTAARRMPDVDSAVIALLDAAPATVRLLDVGVSSGITTLELVEAIERAGRTVQVTACDLSVHGVLRHDGATDLLLDPDGHVLQLATPWLTKGRPHDPGGALRRRLLQALFEWFERRAARAVPGTAPGDERLLLISQVLAARQGVSVVGHDLTRHQPDWQDAFDVVRAANVLNRSYFDEPTLVRMLAYLRGYLRSGGLMVLNRTLEEDGVNHGTILRKLADGRLTALQRLGRGSEVEALALGLPPTDAIQG
jgi:hypothetical protein